MLGLDGTVLGANNLGAPSCGCGQPFMDAASGRGLNSEINMGLGSDIVERLVTAMGPIGITTGLGMCCRQFACTCGGGKGCE
mmetsp:Transcript_91916/g.182609  ORF Transcript_91916/g.182609 Transcript_91916/m.182609 type:complete len:82 (-) Transcript_91916:95-340(-)